MIKATREELLARKRGRERRRRQLRGDEMRRRSRGLYRLNPARRLRRNRASRLNVDHDHTTGRVRGLLCAGCNHRVIGDRTIDYFRCVVRYLEAA